MTAPLQERSRYGDAQPFWVSVSDEVPVPTRSLCSEEALASGARRAPS